MPENDLFQGPGIENLFAVPDNSGQLAENTAANKAHGESLVLNDPQSYQQRKLIKLQGDTVEDQAITRLRDISKEQELTVSGVLQPGFLEGLSPEEKTQRLIGEIKRIDLRDQSVDQIDVALFELFRAGGGQVTIPEFEKRFRSVDITDLDVRRQQRVAQGRAEMLPVVNDIVASKGYSSIVEMVRDVTVQDFIPIFTYLSRIGLDQKLLETVKGDVSSGWQNLFIGEVRQAIRDTLVNQGPDEFAQSVRAIQQLGEWFERNEGLAKLVTNYNLLESFEAIFTEEVYNGLNSKNTFDRVFGNLETVLEGVFSVMTIARAGGIVSRAAFRTTNANRARQVATATGNPQVGSSLDEALQVDDLAIEFGMEADEAVPTMLPRPVRFANDLDDIPDGTKDVLARSERIRNEALAQSDASTGATLTPTDQTNVVNREIRSLDLDDGAHVQGRMNTLQMFDNDTGFRMRVVVGESAERGYRKIEDIMSEALDIDPLLETVNIMRVNSVGKLEPVFEDSEAFARAVTKGEFDAATAGRIVGEDTIDESFYLVYDRDRFWHTVDKEVLSPEAFLNSGVLPRAILSPNAKFGDEIYGSFVRAYMGEQALLKNFEILFEPFYKLGPTDKKFVASAFEWMEDFGKNHGRAPTVSETLAKYDGVTEAQLNGMVAMREGMDTLHELFNRKLYREWQALGYKTGRPADNTLPTYHGNDLERGAVPSGSYLDPETGKMVNMLGRSLDDLYNGGGRVMKLDMTVDAANEAGHKADLIILRDGTYEVSELSTRPLVYHPGYSVRFYDDPYYVVKNTTGVSINGSLRTGANSVSTEAIRTAGTAAEAERFIRRASRRVAEDGQDNVTFEVIRGNNLSNTESTLFQKEALHREGRMFWDTRNFDRLPDVNGNRAVLEDPVKSLERGIALASRQLTHEDPLKSLKNAWKNEYGRFLPPDVAERLDLKEVSGRLADLRKNEVNKAIRGRIKEAKELVDYFRLIEGTESALVPWMREQALNLAAWVGRTTRLPTRAAEKYFQTMDPFRTMRAVAFNAFMVFRPVRQALLQSAQIGFLAGLDPRYVASIQFFKDAAMLRRGLTALRKSGYDDGFSVASSAKAMGLSSKEYRVLIREFDRSGLIDLVDVHSFAGGSRQSQKIALPQSRLGTVGYRAKQVPVAVRDFMQRVGFNFGERNNLTFTYNLALKRTLKRNNYESVLEMTRKNWDDLRVEASNLALGMVRPNNLGYQTGALGVATQFLSFTHKAALGLLGANPAIKGTDALKVLFGSYMLYGANMFGARDFVSEALTQIGVADAEIPGIEGATLVDLISAGIIETTFNALGDMTTEDWKDIDLGFLAPGVDVDRIWELQLKSLLDQPAQAVFGAFGNIFSKTLQSYHFMSAIHAGDPDLDPGEKFLQSAQVISMGMLPAYNDSVMAYLGYQHNQWYSSAGEALPLRPTMNGLLARAAFGARTREELGYYRLQNKVWESQENVRNIVKENHAYLTRQINLFQNGELTDVEFERNLKFLSNWMEEFPEGARLQILKASMISDVEGADSVEKQIMRALSNKQFDPRELIGLVDRFTDIPVEKREQLRALIEEAWQSRINIEAEGTAQIKEQVEEQ